MEVSEAGRTPVNFLLTLWSGRYQFVPNKPHATLQASLGHVLSDDEPVIQAVVGFREHDDWVEIVNTYHVSAKGL